MSKREQVEAKPPTGWCVTNWSAFFEIGGGYKKKGGLEFVRFFVAAGGTKATESSQFLQLLNVLRAVSPQRYHQNVGIYFALVGLTATLQHCYRGWLLDEKLAPLSAAGMAGRLVVKAAVMRTALKDIQRAGLITPQPLPAFDPAADEEDKPAAKKPAGAPKKKTAKKKTAKKAAQGRSRRGSGDISKHLKTFGNISKSLQEEEEVTEMTNGQTKEETLTGQMAKGQGTQSQDQGQANSNPATAPPEGPGPVRPPDVTAGQPRHSSPSPGRREPATAAPGVSGGPLILPLHGGGEAAPLGALLPRAVDGLTRGYALEADAFAGEIGALLAAPFAGDSRDGRRERGNYRAALLDAIDAGLGAEQIAEVMDKGRADAGAIGKHRKRYYRNDGSPEQYWRFRWNKHVAARRSAASRAPPQAVQQ